MHGVEHATRLGAREGAGGRPDGNLQVAGAARAADAHALDLELVGAGEVGEGAGYVLDELGVAPLLGEVEQGEFLHAHHRRAVLGVHAERGFTALAHKGELGLVAVAPGLAGGVAGGHEVLGIGEMAHAGQGVDHVGPLGGELGGIGQGRPGGAAEDARKRPGRCDAVRGGLDDLRDLRA